MRQHFHIIGMTPKIKIKREKQETDTDPGPSKITVRAFGQSGVPYGYVYP